MRPERGRRRLSSGYYWQSDLIRVKWLAMISRISGEVIAFEGSRRIASGPLPVVNQRIRRALDRGRGAVLVFDLESSDVVDLDLRDPVEAAPPAPEPEQP